MQKLIHFALRSVRLAFLAGGVTALPLLAAHAAGGDGWPPPGLYRVDTESTSSMPGVPNAAGTAPASAHLRTDGATGDSTSHNIQGGQKSAGTTYKGEGQQTQCIAPRNAGLPPDVPASIECKTASDTRTADGRVIKQSCGFGDMTLTVRRVDAKTWEYVQTNDFKAGSFPGGTQEWVNGMRWAMEQKVKHASTPEEREKAVKALAELPKMQAEMQQQEAKIAALQPQIDQQRAQAKARGLTLPGTTQVVSRQRLTRISDTCRPAPK